MSPAIFLMGPTASGKSALGVELAKVLGGEVVSVDSALVFRGMDIGTAKPSLEERQGVRHHLIDILDPSESFSTGQFRKAALALMADITARGKLPILVGGTMLYFNALTQGLAELPPADVGIRAELDRELAKFGNEVLHERLAQIDPDSARRIHRNDPQRVQRALEVFAITGKPLSCFFAEQQMDLPYKVVRLVVAPSDRKVLHEVIAKRFVGMVERGLVEEVRALYERGDLDESMPAIRAVGYRQVWHYLQGLCDRQTMVETGIIATRQLAKRQFTWLRRETEAYWFVSEQADLLNSVLKSVETS